MATSYPEILYIAPTDPYRAGLADYAWSYLNAIQNHPHISATPLLDATTPERLHGDAEGVGVVRKMTARALKYRQALGEQIIHAELSKNTQREFWAAQYAARQRPDNPLFLTFHNPPALPKRVRPPDLSPKAGFFERLLAHITKQLSSFALDRVEAHFLNRAAVFIALSRRSGDLLSQHYPQYRHKIAILNPPLIGPPPPPQLEANLRNEKGQKVAITFLGFIRLEKGIEEFIHAVAFLESRKPLAERATIRIRGRLAKEENAVGLEQAFRERIEDLNVERIIDFKPGSMTEKQLNELLIETDVLVLPNPPGACDSTSYTLLRAKAWQVAVVATSEGSMPEMIEHEKTGLLYSAGDATGLADCLERLIEEPSTRLSLTDALSKQALTHNQPQATAEQAWRLYNEAIAARDENRPIQIPEDMSLATPQAPPRPEPKPKEKKG